MVRLRLVDNTMGANYTNQFLFINLSKVDCYINETDRRVFGLETFPEVTVIFYGNERFRVRTSDFNKAKKDIDE